MTHDHDDTLPDALRWKLRALRRDQAPQADLWPGIAQRIAVAPQVVVLPAAPARRGLRSPAAMLATAAALLLALGIGWQLRPDGAARTPPPALADAGAPAEAANPSGPAGLPAQARAMTVEYRAALLEFETARAMPLRDPALRELDRSAAEVRTALARDPGARFLLERLQHVYARRLALTQRLALRA